MGFLGKMFCVFVKGVLGMCDVSHREPVKAPEKRLNSALSYVCATCDFVRLNDERGVIVRSKLKQVHAFGCLH
jgi:hypothetical protein